MDWFQLRLFFVLSLAIAGCVTTVPLKGTPDEPNKATPQRLLLMMFDGMTVDSIERFHLSHFEKLQSHSQNYPNAFVGYVGSVPAVSHMVIAVGKKPKELPLQDEIFYDIEGKIGEKGRFYVTSDLTIEQLQDLEEQDVDEEVLLSSELKYRFGGKVFAVGEPKYAAVELGTRMADSVITLKQDNGSCILAGVNVPAKIASNPQLANCPKKGHPDIDTWVADVALDILKSGDWTGLLLSFPGINQALQKSNDEDLEKAMKLADEQLGRIIDMIEQKELKKETLVVVTAGHGSQENLHRLPNFIKNKNVLFSYQDTAIRIWMKDRQLDRKPVIQQLRQNPAVTEIFELQRDRFSWSYRRVYSDFLRQPKAFVEWSEKRSKEIVDASATVNSPDLIALLADQTGLGPIRYGGAQESVQRVPFMIMNPKLKPFKYYQPIRAYEFKGEIFRQFSR